MCTVTQKRYCNLRNFRIKLTKVIPKRPFIDYLVDTRDDDWYNFTWCEDHTPPDFTPDANCEQYWAEPIAQCMETCDNGVRFGELKMDQF